MEIGAAQDESAEVLAFIADRRAVVLRSATADLTAASIADLPAVTHRLRGVLGSYGLREADQAIVRLSAVLGTADADSVGIEAARRTTIDALTRISNGEPT